ncbi:MAG: tetratricopeptide repeat protein, partial [Hyphomicrobiales bacterium]|nr:tetratricopeptide repeat protein [Hyphomicrobiales bacterium]
YLGYSWVDNGLNYDEALGMIKKAADLRPEDGYIVDSLGWVYYKLGRYEDAVRELERAVTLRPDDPLINDHLGDAYWRAGRRLEARFQWTHARDLKPEPQDLPRILKKLEDGLEAAEDDAARVGQNGAGGETGTNAQ